MLVRFLLCSSIGAIAFAQDTDATTPPPAKPFQFTGAFDWSFSLGEVPTGADWVGSASNSSFRSASY
jgi:hypothetical protein